MRIGVIGSGPSGIAAAAVLLDKGHQVTILDGGHVPEDWSRKLQQELCLRLDQGLDPTPDQWQILRYGPAGSNPDNNTNTTAAPGFLRSLLVRHMPSVLSKKRILGSTFAFHGIDEGITLSGAGLARSLGVGGLGQVWGAGCFPLRPDEYGQWPFSQPELEPYLVQAAHLLHLWQQEDGLCHLYPLYGPIQTNPDHAMFKSIPLNQRDGDSPAENLIQHWKTQDTALHKAGIAAGRMRLAVQATTGGRDGCQLCGLCFHGCPYGMIFNGVQRIRDFQNRDNFTHRPGWFVHRFQEDDHGVTLEIQAQGRLFRESFDCIILAAGVLSSLRIAADSLRIWNHPSRLVDNGAVLMPALARTRQKLGCSPRTFTMAEAAMGIAPHVISKQGVQISIYSATSIFRYPLLGLFRALPKSLSNLAARLVGDPIILLIYFHSSDSRGATITCQSNDGTTPGHLVVTPDDTPSPIDNLLPQLLSLLKKNRHATGFVPLPLFMKKTPFGFSDHLGGSLPMRQNPGILETDFQGRLFGTKKVRVVDASLFPVFPAQNATYVGMANAMRIADGITADS
ncbi:MAG: hypothetical protein HQL65_01775 [Magnetococcales bacterium]|nr:hypothetical protein [Magnetococcales bacterium]